MMIHLLGHETVHELLVRFNDSIDALVKVGIGFLKYLQRERYGAMMPDMANRFLVKPFNTHPRTLLLLLSTLLYIQSPQTRTLIHLQLHSPQISRATKSQMAVMVRRLKVVVQVEMLDDVVVAVATVVVVVIELRLVVWRRPRKSW